MDMDSMKKQINTRKLSIFRMKKINMGFGKELRTYEKDQSPLHLSG